VIRSVALGSVVYPTKLLAAPRTGPMRRVLERLHQNYRAAAPAALLYLVLTLALLLAYRVEVWGLVRLSYPALAHLRFLEFLAMCAHGDSALLLGLFVGAQVLLLAVAGSPRLQYGVAVTLLGLQAVFCFFAVNFFGIYETPFQLSFWADDLGTDLHSSFASFSAEVSPATWVKIAVALLIVLVTAELVIRRRAPAPREHPVRRRMQALALPTVAVASLLVLLLAVSESEAADLPDEPGVDSQTLADISMNPVYGLLASAPPVAARQATPAPEGPPRAAAASGAAPFDFHFDTTSRAAPAHYEAIPGLARGKRYNVILYFVESTAAVYTDMVVDGQPVTPVLHRLAQNSLLLKNHYANYPLSANAMLNVLTSAYDQNGKKPVVQQHSHIGLTSIPQALKEQGWRTYLVHTGMLGYANQDKFLEVRRFDRIDDKPKITEPPYTEWVGWGLDDRALIKPTLRFIAEDPGKPFFAALFPVCPHHPYAIPNASYKLGEPPADATAHEKMKRKYLDSLHYSDAVVGDLVDALEAAGAMENTLLFVFGDHGEAFYQHEKNYNHPLFLYEENVHVPFLVYNKKLFPQPVVFDGVTRHVDILPTILDLVGAPPAVQQEGISFASAHEAQLALMHTSYKEDLTAIRDGKWKYIVRTSDKREELYDLNQDPLEKKNLAAAQKEVVRTYREIVARSREHKDEYYRRALKDFPELQPPPGPSGPDAGADADAPAAGQPVVPTVDAGAAAPEPDAAPKT
jgi:arylsulfatase A-like enzyme